MRKHTCAKRNVHAEGPLDTRARNATDHLRPKVPTPSHGLRESEETARIEAVFDQLSEADRTLYALRKLEMKSNAEAALALGLTPAAASMRFKRLRDFLRRKLESPADDSGNGA